MLDKGIKGYQELTVTQRDTAAAHKSGTLQVLATPALAALMEETAWKSVSKQLEPGMGTVGIRLDIRHLSPTPVGIKVWCDTELREIDGRKLVFGITAFDETGKIGEGIHERVIVEEEKFQKKAESKHSY